jgi:putative membrane protein
MDKNVRTALIIGGIIVAALIVLPLVFGLVSGGQYGGWGMMGGYGTMFFMPILGIVFLGLIIWAIVALVRGVGESRGTGSSMSDSALEILKRRYARGEINKEEYEEKKKDLV